GSCSFNKAFYQAEKLPAPPFTTQLINRKLADTTLLIIGNEQYQPLFTDVHKNPKELDFSIESVIIKSSSGNDLVGWFFKPVSVRANGITLLFLHGNAGNLLTQMQHPLILVKKGFQVLLVDYSGYGYSKGKSTRRHFLQDGNSALLYLAGRA